MDVVIYTFCSSDICVLPSFTLYSSQIPRAIKLVGSPSVLEFERHHFIIVIASVVHEGNFGCIQRVHLDLVVSWVCVHETRNSITQISIDKFVYVEKWLRVLGTCQIEVIEIYVHLIVVWGLFQHHDIGQPCGILNITYKLCLIQLLHFPINEYSPLLFFVSFFDWLDGE